MIDEAFARVQAQHLADKKLAAGPEGQARHVAGIPARKGAAARRGTAISIDGNVFSPVASTSLSPGGKVDRAVVHGRRQRLVHQMHDELPAAVDVARGVLRAEIGLALQAAAPEAVDLRRTR